MYGLSILLPDAGNTPSAGQLRHERLAAAESATSWGIATLDVTYLLWWVPDGYDSRHDACRSVASHAG